MALALAHAAIAPLRVAALTSLAMVAFAGDSRLCRVALTHSGVDAVSFTSIRLVAGSLVLWLVVALRQRSHPAPLAGRGN